MKILVCISSVPDTTSKINFTADKTAFDKTGIQWVINTADEFALTKAVQLQTCGHKVSVISVGSAEVEPVLRKCLAIGADDAIRVNYSPMDSFSTAQEIANIVKANNYDIILCGKESIDYNGGAVPGILAELLEIPFVNSVNALSINEQEVNISREIDGGKENLSAKTPIVLAVTKGLVPEKELIIPNMRGIMSARTKPLQVVEATAQTKVESISFENTPARANVKLISPYNLDELVRLLHEEAKVI